MTRLLIVLAVILLAFGVMLAVGVAGDRDGSTRDSPRWMDWLGVFVSKEAIQPRDFIGACLDGRTFVVAMGRPCTMTVRRAETTIRTLTVELSAGLRGRVRLTPKGGAGAAVDVPLRGATRRTPALTVLEDGAELVLTCEIATPLEPCRFGLGK